MVENNVSSNEFYQLLLQNAPSEIAPVTSFGSIYTDVAGTLTNERLTTAPNFTGLLFENDGLSSNDVTVRGVDGFMTIGTAATYRVDFSIAFEGNTNTEFIFVVFNNGVPTHIKTRRKIGSNSDVGSASCSGYLDLVAEDELQLGVSHDSFNVDLAVRNAMFQVESI